MSTEASALDRIASSLEKLVELALRPLAGGTRIDPPADSKPTDSKPAAGKGVVANKPTAEAKKGPTKDDVKKALTAYQSLTDGPTARAVIKEAGAEGLAQVKPDKYQWIIDRANELAAAKKAELEGGSTAADPEDDFS